MKILFIIFSILFIAITVAASHFSVQRLAPVQIISEGKMPDINFRQKKNKKFKGYRRK